MPALENKRRALGRFLYQLRERRVIRVAIGYVAVGWLSLEAADLLVPIVGLPDWTLQLVLTLIVIGFPLALALAWVFDITPSGLEKTDAVPDMAPDLGSPPEPDSAIASVAVLPFENLSRDPDHVLLADGIAAELHSTLSGVNRLRIASKKSSFAHRDSGKTIAEIGKALNVDYVLSGSLICNDNAIRVFAVLDEAATERQRWAERYEGNLDDFFQVERDIAESIAGSFGGARLRKEIQEARQTPTSNLDAWGLVQKARSYLIEYSPHSLNEAIKSLELAIELDSNYAAAHATLGLVIAERMLNGLSDDPDGDRAAALAAVERAERFAASDPFVLKMTGCTLAYIGEVTRSIIALRKAVDSVPFDFGAWGYFGWPLTATGNRRDLLELQRILDRLLKSAPKHPGTPYWHYHKSVAYSCLGASRKALTHGERSIEFQPKFALAYMQLANAYGTVGNVERANWAADNAKLINKAITPEFVSSLIETMCASQKAYLARTNGLRQVGLLT